MGHPFFVVGEGIWARLRRGFDFLKGAWRFAARLRRLRKKANIAEDFVKNTSRGLKPALILRGLRRE
jgi:hypothetical protein